MFDEDERKEKKRKDGVYEFEGRGKEKGREEG